MLIAGFGPPVGLRRFKGQKRESIWDGQAGGVAVLTRKPGPAQALGDTYKHPRMIQAATLLRHSRRWVLAATAPGTGRMPVLVGTLYGLANARNSKTAKAQNEKLIQAGLDLLVGAGDLPALFG